MRFPRRPARSALPRPAALRKAGLLACLLAIPALAGCADAASAPLVPSGTDASAAAGAGPGLIAGVVVNEGIRPLVGATVHLMEKDLAVTTGEDGRFQFSGLDEGTYFLNVTAPFHRRNLVAVEVEAGRTTNVKALLVEIPDSRPYHIMHAYKAHSDLWNPVVGFRLPGVGNDTLDSCDCRLIIELGAGVPTAFVFEAVWEDSVSPPTGPTRYGWQLCASSCIWEDQAATSPMRVVVPADDFVGEKTVRAYVYPDYTAPQVNQDWEFFVSVFYNGLPPEGWGLVAGGGQQA